MTMGFRAMGRVLLLLTALAAVSPPASAYYYWMFFANGTGPYTPLAAHYDMNALKDNTVQYFISDQAPGPLMPGDNVTAIYSEIRQAAAVWNDVASSALRLHLGGIRKMNTPQTVPGIDVVFDDNIPPGIIAQTKLTFPADLTFLGAKGTSFVPILRAKIQLRKDLTAPGYQQPSYSDEFFTTLVHEFGHALGLQHTFTSSAMSTAITRASTRGLPLAADDVSGISLLYPAGSYRASTGSLTGQVLAADGTGINLASVVALSPNGMAISGMTRPDGSYRIDGIPPGQYFIYVHPLPPAQAGEGTPANIMPPVDAQNDDFSANTKFATQFYPGTQDWTKAAVIGVAAGKSIGQIDFIVTARSGPAVYGMQTYGYPNGVPIAAPPLVANTRNGMVFYATGATVNAQSAMAPGLNVSVIGATASIEPGSLKYYWAGFIEMIVDTAKTAVNLPVALAVTLNGDLYVLPAAFTVVPGAAPSISAVTPQAAYPGGVATTISGTNLTGNTRILFEGSPAKVLRANADGSLAIAEPAGLSGSQATVEAVNPDGQSSLQSLGAAPRPLYTYPQLKQAKLVPTPYSVIAGTDTLMVISGIDAHFAEGETVIGFGSSDISVRGSWVVGPHMVILSLSVDAGAQPGTTYISAATGLEILTQVDGLQILAADPQQISLRVPILNAVTGLAGVPAGGTALIATSGLPANLDGWTLSIGPLNATFTADKNGRLTVNVPTALAVGAQPVQLTAPGNPPAAIVPRVILQLDPAPPVILAAVDTPLIKSTAPAAPPPVTFAVSAATPAQPGDTVTLTVYGLSALLGYLPGPGAVWVNIGGTVFPVTAVVAVPPDPKATPPPLDFAYVRFILPQSLAVDITSGSPKAPVMVGTGTRLSPAYALDVPVSPPPAP